MSLSENRFKPLWQCKLDAQSPALVASPASGNFSTPRICNCTRRFCFSKPRVCNPICNFWARATVSGFWQFFHATNLQLPSLVVLLWTTNLQSNLKSFGSSQNDQGWEWGNIKSIARSGARLGFIKQEKSKKIVALQNLIGSNLTEAIRSRAYGNLCYGILGWVGIIHLLESLVLPFDFSCLR